jgi:hypothetical protein
MFNSDIAEVTRFSYFNLHSQILQFYFKDVIGDYWNMRYGKKDIKVQAGQYRLVSRRGHVRSL